MAAFLQIARAKGRSMILTFTLALWLLWKAHPDLMICAAFWLCVIWTIHAKNLIRYGAGLIILMGVVLNATVTELNGGVMPVVGMPNQFRAAAPIWQSAQTNNHLLFLADHASLHFFSIGDLVLLGGASLLLVANLHQKLKKAALDVGVPQTCPNRNLQPQIVRAEASPL
jgi:hypothetical protein